MAAIPYSTYILPTTPKPILVIFMTCFLLLASSSKVHLAEALSFNITNFSEFKPNITLRGNAKISENGILELTNREKPTSNIGHAVYTTPVPIWDKTTGNVASFVTSFSFVVNYVESCIPANSFVFFLAPTGTGIHQHSDGCCFNQFVRVEFDTYTKPFDLWYPRVGINVNCSISRTVKWNIESGSLVKVIIIYDSLSKTLSVAVIYKNEEISTVSQVVDLKVALPEEVTVGFSSTTCSGGVQTCDIHSWSFNSVLETTTCTSVLNCGYGCNCGYCNYRYCDRCDAHSGYCGVKFLCV